MDTLILFLKRAFQDIFEHKFLQSVTIMTIALSMLIISAFVLIFINTGELMKSWEEGIRIMAYLQPRVSDSEILSLTDKIRSTYGVRDVQFVSKQDAMEKLRQQMKRQASILEDLKENPLPDAFEIRMLASSQSWEKVELLAKKLETIPQISDVEYGQRWLGRFSSVYDLIKLTGLVMGILFFFATGFIVANTIRLVLYSRRDEVATMRLVGATDSFIYAPFYIVSLIQGALGAILGISVLLIAFIFVASNVGQGFATEFIQLKFISLKVAASIIIGSMLVGWLGCFISVRQFTNK